MDIHEWGDPSSRVINEQGARACMKQPKSPYSKWRRRIGHGCLANDIDWVEWRIEHDEPRYIAVIETTHYEDKPELRHLLPNYCATVRARFSRDGQFTVVMRVAALLRVPAYLVVVREDCAVFFICPLPGERWSRAMTESEYRSWLIRLGSRRA